MLQACKRRQWLCSLATDENIKGGVAVFWPGMDRYVRLCQYCHARHAVRFKRVHFGFQQA
jgi:hypothetical protein